MSSCATDQYRVCVPHPPFAELGRLHQIDRLELLRREPAGLQKAESFLLLGARLIAHLEEDNRSSHRQRWKIDAERVVGFATCSRQVGARRKHALRAPLPLDSLSTAGSSTDTNHFRRVHRHAIGDRRRG